VVGETVDYLGMMFQLTLVGGGGGGGEKKNIFFVVFVEK